MNYAFQPGYIMASSNLQDCSRDMVILLFLGFDILYKLTFEMGKVFLSLYSTLPEIINLILFLGILNFASYLIVLSVCALSVV